MRVSMGGMRVSMGGMRVSMGGMRNTDAHTARLYENYAYRMRNEVNLQVCV